MNTILLMMIVVALIGSLTAWSGLLRRWRSGQSLVAWQPHEPVPWGLFDLVVTIAVLVVVSVSAMQVVVRLFSIDAGTPLHGMPSDTRTLVILIESVSTLLTFLISISLIRLRVGARWIDVGVDPIRFGEDTRLGVQAFLVLAPIVYGLQIVLVQWIESKHPLVELMKEHPDGPTIVVSVLSAVVVAPVVEEYLFRVLLQGWLEKIADEDFRPVDLVWGRGDAVGQPPHIVESELGNTGTARPDPEMHTEIESANRSPQVERAAIWPVVVSSLVFSLLHFSHGPDWIPLFILALGLGYIYRQTHRVLPCIVVHFLLNASSMGVFLLEVLGGTTGGP